MKADPEALRQALAEPGLQTAVARVSWREYPAAVAEAVADAIARRLSGLGLPIGKVPLEMLAWVVVGLLLAAVAILVIRAFRGRRAAVEAPPEVTPSAARLEPADAPQWRARAEERLARGDLRGALEAAWWWLATRLAADVVASRTTREVVLQAERRDMLPLAQRLDRLTFGAAPPGREDVRRLLHELGTVLS